MVQMVFYCQKESFAQSYVTAVVSCQKTKLQVPFDVSSDSVGKKGGSKKQKPSVIDCYEVLFEDTVLFPEGGGQPDDRGILSSVSCQDCREMQTDDLLDDCTKKIQCLNQASNQSVTKYPSHLLLSSSSLPIKTARINAESLCSTCGANVLRVIRRGGEAVHYVDKPFEVGSSVEQLVDWPRRKDHMQQHSGQHLITALADNLFGYATTSWSLGTATSSIELATRELTEEKVRVLESRINEGIAAALPVTVTEHDIDDPLLDERIRSRGLPSDHVGRVRVVSIAGVDANMCCGTHVTNTAQLQAVKLLGTEAGKQGKTLLIFVAGDRLLRYLSDSHATLRSLTALLCCAPDQFGDMVRKAQSSLKAADKSSREALKDLAMAEAKLFRLQNENATNKLWCHHRRLADMDFLSTLVASCDDEGILKILTAGEDKGPGLMLIHGPQDAVAELAPRICSVLEGKGGGKSRFTAKVNALHKREEAFKIAEEYMASTAQQ